MSDSLALRDNYSEQRLYASRLSLAVLVVLVSLSVIGWRYFSLQVIEHSRYTTESERNRVHVQAVAPKRGLIKDRNGVLLAENRPSRTLGLVKERLLLKSVAVVAVIRNKNTVRVLFLPRLEKHRAQVGVVGKSQVQTLCLILQILYLLVKDFLGVIGSDVDSHYVNNVVVAEIVVV